MTSTELKHQVKIQEWSVNVQNCRSSGLPVKAWCAENGIPTGTYYRWEKQLLELSDTSREVSEQRGTTIFAALPAPRQVSQNVSQRCATLHINGISVDLYQGIIGEDLQTLVEVLRKC